MMNSMMNKQLQRWMDRPGWQLCLYQWGILVLVGASVYGMVLRPLWQQQWLAAQKIIQCQQQVDRQKSALAQLPSLISLEQQIAVLSAVEAPWQQSKASIGHLVGQWIVPFGGQVISWQRQSEQPVEPGADSSEQQQWHATLRVNFYGLLHLLRQLAATSSPVQVEIMGITREKHALTVKLNLKKSFTGGESE